MSDQHKSSSGEQDELRGEMLSALLDGETSEFETRRILQNFDQDDEQKWRSYSLIQQAMHNQADEIDLSIDVSEAVSQAIAAEPCHSDHSSTQSDSVSSQSQQQPKSVSNVSYLKPVVGFAAAAAFAFVTVINLDGFQQSNQSEQGFVAEGNVSASQLSIQGGVGLSAVSAQVELPNNSAQSAQQLHENIDLIEQQKRLRQQRLDYYLQQHAEQSSHSNGRGLIPMVRVVKDDY